MQAASFKSRRYPVCKADSPERTLKPRWWSSVARRNGSGRASAQSEKMTIFKCPYCRTEYELIWVHLSFNQRSYANCQVCHKAMYSWSSRNVPRLTLVEPAEGTGTIIPPIPMPAS